MTSPQSWSEHPTTQEVSGSISCHHMSSPRLQHPDSYQGTTAPTATLAAWPMDPCITTVHGLHSIPSVTLTLPDKDTAALHLPCAGLSHNCWCLVILAEGGTQLPTSPPCGSCPAAVGLQHVRQHHPPSLLGKVKVLPGLQLQGWCGDAPGPQAVLTRSLPQSPVLPPADDHGPDLCQAEQWASQRGSHVPGTSPPS